MPQNEDPVNSERPARDFRKFMWKSRPLHHRSGRPSLWALIAAKDASIVPHFSRTDIRLETDMEIGDS